ncbi:transcriptional regulator [Parasphingopyxis algicola]|uniref:cupin-like domain-containing protein n=1 Tax=Parasphingopyxis algicola TaxID=2026624 RepID=UPI0015A0289B|nr:cupin-like domain-containing protein [Parasphingopyxis algicola]QLC25341.1 transcriptional regulator [Parasphingopyxis algicola]
MSDPVFVPEAVADLAEAYPEQPVPLRHRLSGHPLLQPDALIALAGRMRPDDMLCFRGDIAVDPGRAGAPPNGLSAAETIRSIATNRSWMVFKAADQDPDYGQLLDGLLGEVAAVVEPVTGPMLGREAFIFVSSPGSVTPFHMDGEHNILLQLTGEKRMTVFPADDENLAPGEAHEAFHLEGHYNLVWRDDFAARGTAFRLTPGEALYVPVKAPHWVKNGTEPSISLSITWRSAWSYEEQYARQMNAMMRRFGLDPAAPKRFPHRNRAKSLAWRTVEKARRTLGGAG